MKAHRKNGGIIFQRKYKVTIDKAELNQPLKRLAFTHPSTPTLETGGFMAFSICSICALAMVLQLI
jgi:hypothetical protein